MSTRLLRNLTIGLGTVAIAACTNGATSFNPPQYVANIPATSKLQLAVGTATIATSNDAISPTTFIGTNFVTTFRGVDGHSATTANTPTLTGPPGFSFGAFLGGGNVVSGRTVPQMQAELALLQSGTPAPAVDFQGFGPLIGVFGYGMAADNLVSDQLLTAVVNAPGYTDTNVGTACLGLGVRGAFGYLETVAPVIRGLNGLGMPFNPPTNDARSAELGLPLLSANDQNSVNGLCPDSANALNGSGAANISYYGGPPAWPTISNANNPDFFLGYPVGFTDFAVPPVVGTYTLSTAFPTAPDFSSFGHVDAPPAQMTNTTGLGAIAEPTFVLGGDGSATAFVNVPAGVTETVVFANTPICDPALSQGFSAANEQPLLNYAVLLHGTGRLAFQFPANLGPPNAAGVPRHTFCTPSDYTGIIIGSTTITAVGFDYPAFEASYPGNLSQTPTISNAAGQADITTSYPLTLSLAPAVAPAAKRKR